MNSLLICFWSNPDKWFRRTKPDDHQVKAATTRLADRSIDVQVATIAPKLGSTDSASRRSGGIGLPKEADVQSNPKNMVELGKERTIFLHDDILFRCLA